MKPLIDLDRLLLTKAQKRDLSMILKYLEPGDWVTSISLSRMMFASGEYYSKEISKNSARLSKLYKETNLLERKESRKILIHKRLQTIWAYRIKPDAISFHEYNPEN